MRTTLLLALLLLSACGERGPEWLRVEVPTTVTFNAVHGSAPTNIWVVGEGGTVLQFNGTDFLKLDAKVPANLNGVWAAAPNDVWIVGDEGTVLRFDGFTFTRPQLNTSDKLTWVLGLAANDVYVGSSSHTWHWTGAEFLEIQKGGLSFSADAWAGTKESGLWLIDDDDVYVGSGGSFTPITVGASGDWQAIAAGPGEVWLFDGSYTGEKALRFDGQTWAVTELPTPSTGLDLTVSWVPQPGHVWFAGGYGNIVHLEAGAPVLEAAGGYGAPRINGVWGSTAGDMWAVGKDGWVLRRYVTP